MCEFPYRVILADKFAESFDGVSSRMVMATAGTARPGCCERCKGRRMR